MKKKNVLWSVLTIALVGLLSLGFTSCDDDDSGDSSLAGSVVGKYTGTLKPIGYSDDPASCYVKIEKLSDNAVRLENLICEEFDMDMNPINLVLSKQSDGRITLQTETSRSIEGTYYKGRLTLTFSTSYSTFYFSGSKN